MDLLPAITELLAGDIVWGHPFKDGKKLARRKGIVLGRLAEGSELYVVWWHTMGDAGADTCTLLAACEVRVCGDIWEFKARDATRIVNACQHYPRANRIRNNLTRHALRMRSAGIL